MPLLLAGLAASPLCAADATDPVLAGDDNGNEFVVQLQAGNPALLEVRIDGVLALVAPVATLQSLVLDGGAGDDRFVVDYGNGFFHVPITLNGHDQATPDGDALITLGAIPGDSEVVYTAGAVAADGKSGSIDSSDGIDRHHIAFTGLEPIESLTVTSLLTINADGNANTIKLVTGPLSTGNDPITMGSIFTYQVNFNGALELMNFRNKDFVFINALAGIDTITMDLPLKLGDALTDIFIAGGDGDDVITVNRTPAGVVTAIDGGLGNDTLNVGGNQTLSGILGIIEISAGAGVLDTVNLNDQLDAGPRTYAIGSGSVDRSGAALITYDQVEAMTVNASAGADTIGLGSTLAPVTTTINGGGGNDTVNVGLAGSLDSLAGPVTLNGGTGANTVDFEDQGDASANTYLLTASSYDRSSTASIGFGSFGTIVLRGGLGNDTIFVSSTTAGAQVSVDDGGGDDIVNVGSAAQSLDGMLGAVTYTSAGGTIDTINFNDQGDAGPNVYAFSNTILARTGIPTIKINSSQHVTINASLGNDTMNLIRDTTSVPVTIHGGGGDNTFVVGSGDLSMLPGVLVFDGGPGASDSLTFNDSANAVPAQYELDAGSFSQNGVDANTAFSGFETITLRAGTAADAITVGGAPGPAIVEIQGGQPSVLPGDQLNYFGPTPNGVMTTGPDSGNIMLSPTQLLEYIQIEELRLNTVLADGFESG